MGVGSFLFGDDAEEYKADPKASSLQGGYGAISNAQNQLNTAQGRGFNNVRGARLETGAYDQVRGQQQGLANQLNDAAQGKGPSAAGMAAQAQRDSSLSQAAALQAGRRGQSAGMGIRSAHNAAVMGGQQAAQNEMIGRANEMATARGQLGGVLSGMAGQDIGIAGQNAGFSQQANLANQNAFLQNRSQNDSYTLGLGGQLLGAAGQEMGARGQQEQMAFGNLDPGSQGLLSPGTIVGLGSAAATALSDANAKTGVQTIGIGQRIAPRGRASAGDWGDALGRVVSSTLLAKATDHADKKKQAEEDKKAKKAKEESREERRQEMLDWLSMNDRRPRTPAPAPVAVTTTPGAPVPQVVDPEMPPPPGAPVPYAVSDEDAKTEKRKAREMLDEVTPYSYLYKPDAVELAGQPKGRQIGVMAQDLERSEAGKEMVGRDPASGYKTVDYLKGLPTMMAGLADIEDRLTRVEGKKKGSKRKA